ncbi:carbamoyl-phosphate synthase [Dunaliella salina]|uniref:Carbamoyl-phosphate synthase n=1 Tax=Dunaliella salina TaxID=3046 RepID=A0ABQ7GPR5_DUNSA|nr:carbamoyl-phosphate synthase [Dunaliella salina]|eukprot:KAF5836604.1 carbamoyl-phosphate synthase [Dunaliella salina]
MQVHCGTGTSIVSSGRVLKDVPHVAPLSACWAGSRSKTTSSPAVAPSGPSAARVLQVVQRKSARTPARVVTKAAGEAVPSPWKKKDSRLALEDGSVLWGEAFGAPGTQLGEVVFNTAMCGYQEVMTDPSYKGQFVCFTCPHIGNVGINLEDMESEKVHLAGIVVRDLSVAVSNYRATMSLDEYCKQQGTMGISGIDTRDLTRALREVGCLVGVMSTDMTKTDEVQGMVWNDKKAMTIQYHPEASPGPHDADVSFEQFVNWMDAERSKKAVAA